MRICDHIFRSNNRKYKQIIRHSECSNADTCWIRVDDDERREGSTHTWQMAEAAPRSSAATKNNMPNGRHRHPKNMPNGAPCSSAIIWPRVATPNKIICQMATATADVASSRCPWLVQLNYGGLRPHFHEAIWSSIESVYSTTKLQRSTTALSLWSAIRDCGL